MPIIYSASSTQPLFKRLLYKSLKDCLIFLIPLNSIYICKIRTRYKCIQNNAYICIII